MNLPFSYQQYVESKCEGKCIVYKYTDIVNDKVVYVGNTCDGKFPRRHLAHVSEKWYKDNSWLLCEFFFCKNKSEAEMYETHFINKYHNECMINKAKVGYGTIEFIDKQDIQWVALLPMIGDLLCSLESYIDYCESRNNRSKHSYKEATSTAFITLKDFWDDYMYIQTAESYLKKNGICRL